MPNFFADNADIQFHMNHMDLREVVSLKEGDFSEARDCPYAPASYEDAADGYRRVMDLVGSIAGDIIAPRAEDVDRTGPVCENGGVTYAKGTRESIEAMAGADLMGFTLPRKYGGLNMPTTM